MLESATNKFNNFGFWDIFIVIGIGILVCMILATWKMIKLNYFTKLKHRKRLGKYKDYKPKYDFKHKWDGSLEMTLKKTKGGEQ